MKNMNWPSWLIIAPRSRNTQCIMEIILSFKRGALAHLFPHTRGNLIKARLMKNGMLFFINSVAFILPLKSNNVNA